MIQELLGGNSAPTGFFGERKISIPFSSPNASTPCPSSTPILTTTITTATLPSSTSLANSNNSNSPGVVGSNTQNTNNTPSEANTTSQQQNLRCPRCDSTNTKFCYYNNYNLTQPRHFCKTCRRYWTKGGTLRNVPIGGGCRKNKTIPTGGSSGSSGLVKSSSNAMAKAKATLSTELLVNGNPGFLGTGLLDHLHHHPELHSSCPNPILWPSLPQNSHILSLLRGSTTQFHNPNPSTLPNVFTPVKTECNTTTTLGLDSYCNGAPSNLLGSFSRSNHQQSNGFSSGAPDFAPNNGNNSNILELYHKLKSSSNYNNYCSNESPAGTVVLGNMVGSTTPNSPIHSTVLDPGSVGGADHFGGHGFMNTPGIISGWSDFPTVPINGSFP